MSETPHRLRIFLCHSSGDKQAVRALYQRLRANGFDPWIDEENLLPGQDWEKEITRAVRTCDIVLVCLSRGAVNKRGFVQKEIKYALDVAEEQPEDTIFLIPLKLEECDIPERLRRWHCISLFEADMEARLIKVLSLCAESLSANPGRGDIPPSSKGISAAGGKGRSGVSVSRAGVGGSAHPGEFDKLSNSKTYFFDQLIRSLQVSRADSGEDEGDVETETVTQERAGEFQKKDSGRNRFKRRMRVVLIVSAVLVITVGFSKIGLNTAKKWHAQYYLDLAQTCRDKGDDGCAIENYSMVMQLMPDFSRAYSMRGAAHYRKGNYGQAIGDCAKAIELDPQDFYPYQMRGLAYYVENNYEPAIKDLSKAIELLPSDYTAYYVRGLTSHAKGDFDKAIQDLDKAIELDSQDASFYYARGVVYNKIRDYEQAFKNFDKAIELNPRLNDAYKGRADAYYMTGQSAKAIADRKKYDELSTEK
jgi:Flp pilus assembly protein TadD